MSKHPKRRSASKNSLSLERAQSGNAWVFSHPRDVRECAEDLEEVREMIAAGESEVAVDELRWLLEICRENLAAHFLLGKVAVETENDLPLGRGHFGAGYQLGLQAWRRAGQPTPVAALHPANRIFFDCGRGLVWCLHNLQMTPLAVEVVEQMLTLDPGDPLALKGWLDEMRSEGKQIVELGGFFTKHDSQ
jgi:hypothetical protein